MAPGCRRTHLGLRSGPSSARVLSKLRRKIGSEEGVRDSRPGFSPHTSALKSASDAAFARDAPKLDCAARCIARPPRPRGPLWLARLRAPPRSRARRARGAAPPRCRLCRPLHRRARSAVSLNLPSLFFARWCFAPRLATRSAPLQFLRGDRPRRHGRVQARDARHGGSRRGPGAHCWMRAVSVAWLCIARRIGQVARREDSARAPPPPPGRFWREGGGEGVGARGEGEAWEEGSAVRAWTGALVARKGLGLRKNEMTRGEGERKRRAEHGGRKEEQGRAGGKREDVRREERF